MMTPMLSIENDNGKRWRIECRFPDGRSFTMQPIGEVTVGDAEAICNKAVTACTDLERVTKERDVFKAESVSRGRMLIKMRDELIDIRDGLDDQGDLVAFGSTNHADDFRDAVETLDSFKWELILKEKDEPDIFEKCQSANARASAAERERDAAVSRAESARREADQLRANIEELVSDRFKETMIRKLGAQIETLIERLARAEHERDAALSSAESARREAIEECAKEVEAFVQRKGFYDHAKSPYLTCTAVIRALAEAKSDGERNEAAI